MTAEAVEALALALVGGELCEEQTDALAWSPLILAALPAGWELRRSLTVERLAEALIDVRLMDRDWQDPHGWAQVILAALAAQPGDAP